MEDNKYEILNHLKKTILLEGKCFAVEKIIELNKHKRQQYKEMPPRPEPRPDPPLVPEPTPPIKSYVRTQPVNHSSAVGWSAIFAFAVAVIIILLFRFTETSHFNISFPFSPIFPGGVGYVVTFFLIFLILFVIMVGILVSCYEEEHKKSQKLNQEYEENSYKSDLVRYNTELERCRSVNLQRKMEVSAHNEKVMKNYFDLADEISDYNYKAEATNDFLDKFLEPWERIHEKLKRTLEKVYNLGYIHPNYRNFVAYSSFFDYFDTGRCAELEGQGGAYDKFETELRLDKIIYQLDEILLDLKQIQRNQYCLFCEISKANQNIERLTACFQDGLNYIANTQGELASRVWESHYTTLNISQKADSYIAELESANKDVLKYLEDAKKVQRNIERKVEAL